jgi:hypothetical protein
MFAAEIVLLLNKPIVYITFLVASKLSKIFFIQHCLMSQYFNIFLGVAAYPKLKGWNAAGVLLSFL